ncbi:uncharacterized protein LOC143039680 [Oratosquilla oratoria]|uniref:uncharacterized protein LOC143039680 n=1 Tax=Oratosquilla oratoria TaxID=337810 RepID=UPI003F75D8BF
MEGVKEFWEKVPRKCLNGVWKHLCPQLVYDFVGFDIQENVSKANKESLDKAREARFDQLEQKDIDELLELHTVELTNEELLEMETIENAELEAAASRPISEIPEPERFLTKSDLEKAPSFIREGLDILEAKDPNINRSATLPEKLCQS